MPAAGTPLCHAAQLAGLPLFENWPNHTHVSSLLKKGTGSEPNRINAAKKGEREVPVPLFQRAVRPRLAYA
jgi:hypothetical protein